MFDDRVCKRGALLLQTLRLTLGDDDFFTILKGWAYDHAHGTVSTEILLQFVEAHTDTAVATPFSEWLTEEALLEPPVAR